MATQHIDDLHVSSNTIRCGAVAREIPLTETASREPRTLNHEGDAGRMSFPDASEKTALNGAMQCQLLRWAADQIQLSPHLQGVLVRLVRLMDNDGRLTLPQAQIAPLIDMRERQTRSAIAALVEAGVISRQRRGGIGAGRVADALTANLATGESPPLSGQAAENANFDIGDMSPEASGGKEQPAIGEQSPLSQPANADTGETSPVDNQNQRVIEHACARADTNLKNTTLSELNPETESQASTPLTLTPADSPAPKRKGTKYSSEFEDVWLLWPSNRRANSDKRTAYKRYQAGVEQFGADRVHAAAKRYLSLPDTRKDGYRYCCLVEVFMNGKLEAAVEAINDPIPAPATAARSNGFRANGITRLAYTG